MSFGEIDFKFKIEGQLVSMFCKDTKVINESLGGVLFIDEAYSLGNDDKKIYSKGVLIQ